MKTNVPNRVEDYTEYWNNPPPSLSPRCQHWVNRIRNGWVPNRRVKQMGYDEASQFFGVYIWEYINILFPLFRVKDLVNIRVGIHDG